MQKPLISLYDSVGLGLIISFPSGVEIFNQTGGTACRQSFLEGIYLPIFNDCDTSNVLISPETELFEYFSNNQVERLYENDIQKINEILEKFKLSELIQIDFEKINESHEAWIFVDIFYSERFNYLIQNFDFPLKGVLTWTNSD